LTASKETPRKRKKKSVLKRIRQTERRTAINRIRKGGLRAQVKRLRQAVAAGDLAQARELLPPTLSILDRSAHNGVLHPNTAARTKSRLLLRYNALQKKEGAAARPSSG
jgi:small subunit ribosomal protein S20